MLSLRVGRRCAAVPRQTMPRRICAGTRTASRRCGTGRSSRLPCGRLWTSCGRAWRRCRGCATADLPLPAPPRSAARRGAAPSRGGGRLGDGVRDDARWERHRPADDVAVGGRGGRRRSGRGRGWRRRGCRQASRDGKGEPVAVGQAERDSETD